MKARIVALIAFAWCIADVAFAQQPAGRSRSTAEAAQDKSEAQSLIDSTTHPQLFENVTGNGGPAVRHRATGMVCSFEPGAPTNNLVVYRFDATTEDVSCNSEFDGAFVTHYAYRYTPKPTAEDEARSALAAVINRYPDWKAYEGTVANLSTEGFDRPTTYVSRGVVTANGGPALTKVLLTQIGDWTLKQRMTVPLEDALSGDALSELSMLTVIMDVSAHLGKGPAGN